MLFSYRFVSIVYILAENEHVPKFQKPSQRLYEDFLAYPRTHIQPHAPGAIRVHVHRTAHHSIVFRGTTNVLMSPNTDVFVFGFGFSIGLRRWRAIQFY